MLGALLVLPARLRPLGMGVMVSAALALSIHQALQTRLDPSLEDVPLVVELHEKDEVAGASDRR